MWQLDDMASLRFVYMSMNMRIPQTITLTTRKNPPEWVEAACAPLCTSLSTVAGAMRRQGLCMLLDCPWLAVDIHA